MKATFRITPASAQRIIDGLWGLQCQLESEGAYTYGAHAFFEDNGSATWWTCGGSGYSVYPDGYLVFTGSRRSFGHGSLAIAIRGTRERPEIYISSDRYYGREHPPIHARLVDWETTVPGNPSPYDDWEEALREHRLQMEREAVEAEGWAIQDALCR